MIDVARRGLKKIGSFQLGGPIKLRLDCKKDEGEDEGVTSGTWTMLEDDLLYEPLGEDEDPIGSEEEEAQKCYRCSMKTASMSAECFEDQRTISHGSYIAFGV